MSRKHRYRREDHGHEESSHRERGSEPKKNLWMYSTIVLAVLLAASVSGSILVGGEAPQESPEVVANKAVTFINNNLLEAGVTASLEEVQETSGLLLLKLDISGSEIETYTTKDGMLLFTAAIDLDSDPTPPTQTPPPEDSEVSADDDPAKGPEDAPVTIIEFSDFQCPFCSRVVPTLKQIEQEYGDQVRIVFRDFPLSFHQNAQKAAEAGECADDQGKFWEMHDKMFENQGSLDTDSLKQFAEDLGLDTEEFNSCLDSGKHTQEVQKDFSDGQKAGVTGTPAFFVNGKKLSGAQPFSAFKQLIDQELAN